MGSVEVHLISKIKKRHAILWELMLFFYIKYSTIYASEGDFHNLPIQKPLEWKKIKIWWFSFDPSEMRVVLGVSICRHKTPINSLLHSGIFYVVTPWILEQRKAVVVKRLRWRKWATRAISKSPSPSAEAVFSRRPVSSAPSAEPTWRWWCSPPARRCSPSATPTWTPSSTDFWGGLRCRTPAPCSSLTPTASPTCVTWTSSWLRWMNF